MIRKIKEGLISDRLSVRIMWLTLVFAVVLFGGTVLSCYLLPQGFLLGKNGIADFKTSEHLFLCALQIFLYNMLSVAVIIFGSVFARKKAGEKVYRSFGQVGFLVFILLNAVTLGTWSFTANTDSVPLPARLFRTFDIVHNAGLLEMYGQLLITSALATKYLVMSDSGNILTVIFELGAVFFLVQAILPVVPTGKSNWYLPMALGLNCVALCLNALRRKSNP